MSFTCELSGESLTAGEVVVTPSGHICSKRLLWSKLASNDGVDPFDESRPLTQEQCIELATTSSVMVAPPPPSSFNNLLKSLQQEYDAVLLELFDTRKTLQVTRQELSQALYQNDAAVRVVARLAHERDAARQALRTNKSSTIVEEEEDATQPAAKKQRFSSTLAAEDLQKMMAVWEELHKNRKRLVKEAAAKAPSAQHLAKYKASPIENWFPQKSTITAMTIGTQSTIVTAAANQQVVLYDSENKNKQSITILDSNNHNSITSVDSNNHYLVVATDHQPAIRIYTLPDGQLHASMTLEDNVTLVHVALHPDQSHIVAASQQGTIYIGSTKELLAVLPSKNKHQSYTCAALHPDGLLYLVGTTAGQVDLWDFKEMKMALSLQPDDEEEPQSVTAIHISNNGYHVAVSHASGKVRVWDLRKQKQVGLVSDDALESVDAVAFDSSGKYLAFAGTGGIRVTTVKEWNTVASLDAQHADFLAWMGSTIVSASKTDGHVTFFT